MNTLSRCMVMLSLTPVLFVQGFCQEKDPFILVVVPEADTTFASTSVYRLSASTNPGRTITVNGTPFAVFPSGAFAGLLSLNVGENVFVLRSEDKKGGRLERQFIINRQAPLTSTPADTLRIESELMLPSENMWLNTGDILEVQMKGTPGCSASFMDGRKLSERPASATGGIAGVYRGMYKVAEGDTMAARQIRFKLVNASGDSAIQESQATVSFMTDRFPLVGITRGARPALDFGLGTDRLGGAKLSFLNPGIRLAITGKTGNQYRVELSENQIAWIDDDAVEIQPPGTFLPFSYTGNFNIYGAGQYDYVTLALGDKLPYSTSQELDPTRIYVELYGAVSNSNWITQQSSTSEIKNIYYTQVGKNHFRITIELRHTQVWGYSIGYETDSLVIRIRHQPEKLRLKGMLIAVDAGHGGTNKGALGSTGVLEKEITLSVATHLKQLLEGEGAQVFMTRTDDSFSFNSARLTRAIAVNPSLLVSIHANSVGLTSNPLLVKGTSTYYKHICYRALTQFILERLVKTGLTSFGNVGSFNFTLNSETEIPNVLVETAFLSNPEDEMKLVDDDFRKKLAGCIVDGIEDFLDWCDD